MKYHEFKKKIHFGELQKNIGLPFFSLCLRMMFFTLLGGSLGFFLDRLLREDVSLCFCIGLFAGVACGVYSVYRKVLIHFFDKEDSLFEGENG
ncbi:hypothetical protein AB834_06955 [PVC group bacterium (ex Bugula neritina AB1)]|nr:hypothetical protein AB834_06955 [PVC group bacterium (ex Bugula neritina AB1)]